MASVRCNPHGVYEADQTLRLEREVKGWRGLPTARIELRDLGRYWIWSASFFLMDGDCLGHGHPLVDQPPYRAVDREAALYAAKADLVAKLSDRARHPGDARRVMVWIDRLTPAQRDLFGEAA